MRNRWLAKGTESGQKDKVYSIDPHSGSKAQVSEAEVNTYIAFLTNLTKAWGQAAAVSLVTTSEKCTRRWRKYERDEIGDLVGVSNKRAKYVALGYDGKESKGQTYG